MYLVLWIVGIVGIGMSIYFLMRWLLVQPTALADDAFRQKWYTYLRTDPLIRTIRDSTTADFLLSESKYLVLSKIDAIKSTEAKANAQLSIVGGGIGLLSVFGANQSSILPGSISIVIVAAVLLFVSIGFNVVCITIGRTDVLPGIDVYNSEATARSPS